MFFRSLNDRFRKLMRDHELSDDELRQSATAMKSKQKRTFIGYVIGMIVLAGLFVMHFFEQYNHPTNSDPFWLTVLGGIILVIVCGVVFYFFTVGVFKIQFNKELKKDYPHLYDELKL